MYNSKLSHAPGMLETIFEHNADLIVGLKGVFFTEILGRQV